MPRNDRRAMRLSYHSWARFVPYPTWHNQLVVTSVRFAEGSLNIHLAVGTAGGWDTASINEILAL